MNVGQVFGLIFVTLMAAAGLAALLVTLAALMPRATSRSKHALLQSPRRAFFVGLANYIFLGGIALVLLNAGDVPALLGLLLLGALLAVTAPGLAGLARLTGERLADMRRADWSPFKQMLWGAVTLEIAAVGLPFFGWFVVAPALLATAFGAAVVAWRSRKSEIESLPERSE